MSTPVDERIVLPTFNSKGDPEWRSLLSPPDNSIAIVHMIPDRTIPVIFVPGVMGSNLKSVGRKDGQLWRLDNPQSMAGWITKSATHRKNFLSPKRMALDNGGSIPVGSAQHMDELRRRGWGGVGAMSYSSFLIWLENSLNDFSDPKKGVRVSLISNKIETSKGDKYLTADEVALSYKYKYPVYAFGYNWIEDCFATSKMLRDRIVEIIAYHKKRGEMCEKVILVTHSMGGLVARHCSEVLGFSEKILGIVHGVMPTIGAAAVYRRFKSGTEGDIVTSAVLGRDSEEMTAVLAGAPGPLQLLPTKEYGDNWLIINYGNKSFRFPKGGDPYTEIYAVKGKWWSMCDENLINPDGSSGAEKKEKKKAYEWAKYIGIIMDDVKSFHVDLKGKYHKNSYLFYGCDKNNKAYGSILWNGVDDNVDDFPSGPTRTLDVLNATLCDSEEKKICRTVNAKVLGGAPMEAQRQRYTISPPEEDGDGTVPRRSAISGVENANIKSVIQVSVSHEGAFRDSEIARLFTLSSIVKISQNVSGSSLCYSK